MTTRLAAIPLGCRVRGCTRREPATVARLFARRVHFTDGSPGLAWRRVMVCPPCADTAGRAPGTVALCGRTGCDHGLAAGRPAYAWQVVRDRTADGAPQLAWERVATCPDCGSADPGPRPRHQPSPRPSGGGSLRTFPGGAGPGRRA